jgi:hypothetical protein
VQHVALEPEPHTLLGAQHVPFTHIKSGPQQVTLDPDPQTWF